MSLISNNFFKEANVDSYNSRNNNYNKFIIIILGIFLLSMVSYFFMIRTPSDFPQGQFVAIKEGFSLSQTAKHLKEKKVIRSEFIFKMIVRFVEGQRGVKSGDYFLQEPENVLTVASRITKADFRLTPIKITIPEGSTLVEIADILQKSINNFDKNNFLSLTKEQTFRENNISDKPFYSLEGFLFPDTYFFLPKVESHQVISDMRGNFDLKMTPEIKEEIQRRDLSVYEVITMASLIEEEARQTETRRIVSGILWKRLDAGMALQVDAVFPYIMGKNTFEITLDDLKIDSPYNTYLYKGLPKGPISSPGLDSILAAVYPEASGYWYYLSDKEGNMHYAKTFEGHKANKEKYLR